MSDAQKRRALANLIDVPGPTQGAGEGRGEAAGSDLLIELVPGDDGQQPSSGSNATGATQQVVDL